MAPKARYKTVVPERSSVSVVVFHVVPVAVVSGSAVTKVAEVAVLPVVFLLPHLEMGSLSPGSAGLAEVLGRGSLGPIL